MDIVGHCGSFMVVVHCDRCICGALWYVVVHGDTSGNNNNNNKQTVKDKQHPKPFRAPKTTKIEKTDQTLKKSTNNCYILLHIKSWCVLRTAVRFCPPQSEFSTTIVVSLIVF